MSKITRDISKITIMKYLKINELKKENMIFDRSV